MQTDASQKNRSPLPVLHNVELLQRHLLPIRPQQHYISFSKETTLSKKTNWAFSTTLLLWAAGMKGSKPPVLLPP